MGKNEVTIGQLARLVDRLEDGHWGIIARSVYLDLLAGYAYLYNEHVAEAPAWTQPLPWESKAVHEIISLMPTPQGSRSFEHCLTEVKSTTQLLLAQELGLPQNPDDYGTRILPFEEVEAVEAFLVSDFTEGITRATAEYAVALCQWNDASTALSVIRRKTGENHSELPAPTMPESLISMIQQVRDDES
ncbi:hypothetical protein [Corynebacterium senegalense]|uniref:hypothetical protein n=1 Tax=Corynebacterium senegalense TaxID=2080750 RepID=UPI0011C078B4|nr:hypothetical protein [Corynebacterium senegalense]